MLNEAFIHNGFCFISADHYLDQTITPSIHDLKKIFDTELENDGSDFRQRAYLKLHWERKHNVLTVPENQMYFQTAASNTVDGGKARQFKVMDQKILSLPITKSIIHKNLQMITHYQPLQSAETLTIGMHFIRYQANENEASFSSPDWLHVDDEPLVFIHLIHLSKSALGGDNIIADATHKKITHLVRLENDIDTLVLNKNVYHAVTPLGSRKGKSMRDVILFTVEPNHTQYQAMRECA